MNALYKLWEKLTDTEYREAFVAAQIKRMLPAQIRALRKQREWTQADLASAAKLTQGAISRAEDPDYGNLTINNLLRIAAGFDVAFVGRFVPFSELGKWYVNISSEQSLTVAGFADDVGFREHKPPTSEIIQIDSGTGTYGTGTSGTGAYRDISSNPNARDAKVQEGTKATNIRTMPLPTPRIDLWPNVVNGGGARRAA